MNLLRVNRSDNKTARLRESAQTAIGMSFETD